MRNVYFYHCPECGSVITVFKGEPDMMCCNKKLSRLETKEGNNDKHVPVVYKDEDEIVIEVKHPMEKNHYISFIAYVGTDNVYLRELYPEQGNVTRFKYKGHGNVYAYCTTHGLWKEKI